MEVAAARAKVEQNRAALEDLLDGPSAAELEQAELAVEQARLAAQDVQTRIVGGTVRAPMAGVVTSVSVQPRRFCSRGADHRLGKYRYRSGALLDRGA